MGRTLIHSGGNSQWQVNAVRKSMRQVRMAICTATVNPKLLTDAERLQYEGYLRREDVAHKISDSPA